MAASAELGVDTVRPPPSAADGFWSRLDLVPRVLYWGTHTACLAALWVGVTSGDLALLAASFLGRMFAITAGYHRYFAHRTFRTSRAFQFVLAFLGASSAQKGPLWWAGLHRIHHSDSDGPGDIHSPRRGFWYSHQNWIFDPATNPTPLERIPDFARYPELVWLNRWHFVAPLALIVACFAIGGLSGFVWGFAISTTLLWHSTYTVNSLAHLWGSRRYPTTDDSRNNPWIALLTFGEGWHNNHHHYMASARQGFFWWEIDVTYYLLRGLQAVGLVWDIREPPAAVRDAHRRAA
jgi:stearoyl-CoA desaturase (delta-9 desaturase)